MINKILKISANKYMIMSNPNPHLKEMFLIKISFIIKKLNLMIFQITN